MATLAFVSICFLWVFLVRDAQLLSAGQKAAFTWRLGLYCTVLSFCISVASKLVGASPHEIITAVRSPWVWGISVGLHVAGLSMCLWLRRVRRVDFGWLIGLFPTPMLTLLLLGATGAVARELSRGVDVWTCALVALGWTLSVAAAGRFIDLIGGSDSDFAVNFAAASNSTALALLPFSPFF